MSNSTSTSIVRNYKSLLDEGIRLIETFSSSIWTDYNVHDPGITTLEFLCYALTDLAGRVGLPMESHLAEKIGEQVRLRNDFPEAHQILPCGAVTLQDYRKLLIDLPGVRNAWFRVIKDEDPAIYAIEKDDRLSFAGDKSARLLVRGFYDVELEFDKTLADEQKRQLEKQTRNILMANRNLCEDFNRIGEIGLEEVSVCVDVELTPESNVDEVKAEMLYVLDEFIAPTLRRYTLDEMLDKGYAIEDILNGPFPENGFIEDRDLRLSHNRGELHASDLVHLLMDIPHIVAVRRLLFTTFQDGKVVVQDEPSIIPLAPDRAARFNRDDSTFRFFKEGIPYISNPAGVEKYLVQVRTRHQQAPVAGQDLRPELPEPQYLNTGNYISIQHHYPRSYMIGPEGVSPSISAARKAAVKQFKAYLLLFDQYLADFTGQIGHAVQLLSPIPVKRSFVNVPPADAPLYSELIRDAARIVDYYEDQETFLRRRNGFLDHLLARFAEQYHEYSMLVESIYDADALPLLIRDKERLLNNFAKLSFTRFQAYDYTLLDPAATISGLERNLRIFLGYTSDIDLSVLQERYFEIYEKYDTDAGREFRFRVRDDGGEMLLQSTRSLFTREESRLEMRTVLFAGTDPENYLIEEDEDGIWYFAVHESSDAELGRSAQYFQTREQCESRRDAAVSFFRSLLQEDDIFVLEHILLRPCSFDDAINQQAYVAANDARYLLPTCFDEDDADCCAGDAYSFRITVVMPAWPVRFQDRNFRNFLSRFIREQTPAHVFAKICWISQEAMSEFRPVFAAWEDALAQRDELPDPIIYLNALEQLIGVWSRLRSVYPQVYLYDCTDMKDKTPMVLGDSALGDMKGADDDQD